MIQIHENYEKHKLLNKLLIFLLINTYFLNYRIHLKCRFNSLQLELAGERRPATFI